MVMVSNMFLTSLFYPLPREEDITLRILDSRLGGSTTQLPSLKLTVRTASENGWLEDVCKFRNFLFGARPYCQVLLLFVSCGVVREVVGKNPHGSSPFRRSC